MSSRGMLTDRDVRAGSPIPCSGVYQNEFRADIADALGVDRQQLPPPSTRKNASMSASVPTSPSALKSALLRQGHAGQLPARHAKNASMSASVPTSPSQLKSASPQAGMVATNTPEEPSVNASEKTTCPLSLRHVERPSSPPLEVIPPMPALRMPTVRTSPGATW